MSGFYLIEIESVRVVATKINYELHFKSLSKLDMKVPSELIIRSESAQILGIQFISDADGDIDWNISDLIEINLIAQKLTSDLIIFVYDGLEVKRCILPLHIIVNTKASKK